MESDDFPLRGGPKNAINECVSGSGSGTPWYGESHVNLGIVTLSGLCSSVICTTIVVNCADGR